MSVLLKKVLCTIAAAEYVGCSPRTLEKNRCYGGGPKYAKLGRRVVYRVADLDAWIEEHLVGSTSESTVRDSEAA